MIPEATYALAIAYLKQCESVVGAFQILSSSHRAQLHTDFPTLYDALTIATTIRAQFDATNANLTTTHTP
jgi:hypothetical protein